MEVPDYKVGVIQDFAVRMGNHWYRFLHAQLCVYIRVDSIYSRDELVLDDGAILLPVFAVLD